MEQNKDKLVFKDMCMRLPYGVRGVVSIEIPTGHYSVADGHEIFREKDVLVELLSINVDGDITVQPVDTNYDLDNYCYILDEFTPYLRDMNKMTDEEQRYYVIHKEEMGMRPGESNAYEFVEFCLEHHLDFNNLIDSGLACEAPEGVYDIEN